MMPAINLMTKENFNSPGGDPKQARAEFATNVDYFNWLASVLNGGAAGLPLVSPGGGNAPEYGQLGNSGLADAAVQERNIAANAVTLQKLAQGTPGKAIGFGSGGAAQEVDAGVSGKLLIVKTVDEAITAGNNVLVWPDEGKVFDDEGCFWLNSFFPNKTGKWLINLTIQLSTSSLVQLVTLERTYEVQVNGTQSQSISVLTHMASGESAYVNVVSNCTVRGIVGGKARTFFSACYLGG